VIHGEALSKQSDDRDSAERDAASEMAMKVMSVAELSIKASDRSLSVMMWLLGGCLGGSTLGVAGLWMWLSRFTRTMRKEIVESQTRAGELHTQAGQTVSVFEQMLRSLPLVLVDGIEENDKIVAFNTLAQLRRPELAPVFASLMRHSHDTRIQAAAVYALGLLPGESQRWVKEFLTLSRNVDENLRRECARAMIAIDPSMREIRMRLEEMTNDADDIVRQMARNGLGIARIL